MRFARRLGIVALMLVLVSVMVVGYADDTPVVVDSHTVHAN